MPFDVLVNHLYVCAGGSIGEPPIPEKERLKPSLSEFTFYVMCMKFNED